MASKEARFIAYFVTLQSTDKSFTFVSVFCYFVTNGREESFDIKRDYEPNKLGLCVQETIQCFH
jgi:hypothetical protein